MNKLPNLPLVQERFYHQIKDDLETSKIKYPEFEVLGVFEQMWASTALGFGGWGGQAITDAYTTVIQNLDTGYIGVFFGENLAYIIKRPNDMFYDDLMHHNLKAKSECYKYEKE